MAEMLIIPLSKAELAEFIADSVQRSFKANRTFESQSNEAAELLKIDDVCSILQVSKVTVHKWKKVGKIPFHRISNRIFFKRSEVLAALQMIHIIKMKGGMQ
jgi:excisionase family DNA binding protein